MKVIIDCGFDITVKKTLRFYGIDTPEMRGDEKVEGKISRDWLRDRIYNAVENGIDVRVKTIMDKTGKYGRLLAEVFIGDEGDSLNEQMVDLGLAREYMKS